MSGPNTTGDGCGLGGGRRREGRFVDSYWDGWIRASSRGPGKRVRTGWQGARGRGGPGCPFGEEVGVDDVEVGGGWGLGVLVRELWMEWVFF